MQNNNNPQAKKSSNPISVVKGLQIANIVVAAIFIIISFVVSVSLSVMGEAVEQNGGWESLGAMMANVVSGNSATEVPEIDVNTLANSSSDYTMEELNTMFAVGSDGTHYAELLQSAYTTLVVYNVIAGCIMVVIIILSSIILAKIKYASKAKMCRFMSIWNVIASLLSLNLVIFILSIVSTVKTSILVKFSQQLDN